MWWKGDKNESFGVILPPIVHAAWRVKYKGGGGTRVPTSCSLHLNL